jgi:CheY-like chemotaxis protein
MAMNPVNILLVDDQPAKLLSYEVVLQELGENLIKAQSGREALEHLLRNDIAVILVDVCMPEQDGFELVSMIREHPRYQHTAIIFVSAVMMAEPDRLRGYAAGAVDYVSVPIVPEVLRAKVRVFADLYRKTRELERLNADLEDRVRERTAELEASSNQLRQLNEDLEERIDQRTREREEALAQLFEAQKLDTIGQLTGGVAHDFNNLLMAVLGSLNLLKKRLPIDEKSERLIANAIQAAERGAALTQRLLAFARRQELKPHAVDFAELFENIQDLLSKALGPGVDIGKDIPPRLPQLLVDSNQLELALLNLFVNARDAMIGGGTIMVSAEAERCLEARPPGRRSIRADFGVRHRRGHGRSDRHPRGRAVFHDERAWKGDGSRPLHGARPGGSIGWHPGPVERQGRGDDGVAVAAGRRKYCGGGGRHRRPHRQTLLPMCRMR